jgi:hypothetical protein
MTGLLLSVVFSLGVLVLTAKTELPFLLLLNVLTPLLMCPKADLFVFKEQGLWLMETGKEPKLYSGCRD